MVAHERVARLAGIAGAPSPAKKTRAGCAHAAKPREGKPPKSKPKPRKEKAQRNRKADRVKTAATESQGERTPAPAATAPAGRRQHKVTRAGVGAPVGGTAPSARTVESAGAAARIPPARGRAKGARTPGAAPARKQGTPTQGQGRAGGRASQREKASGALPGVVRLAPETKLRYYAGAEKRGQSAERLRLYRGAGAVGEFSDRHPGLERIARADLTNDLKKGLCKTDPPLRPCDFHRVELDHAGRARTDLAAAARGRAPYAWGRNASRATPSCWAG